MTLQLHREKVLMMAYSFYESDPRVIREAEAALEAGFDVDFLALRREGSATTEFIRGVQVIRLNQGKYRGKGYFSYLLAYLTFFFRCLAKTTGLFFKRRYVVIHVNNMPDFLVFSTLIPWMLGTKIILDIHDSMPNTFASKFRSGNRGLLYWILLSQERLSAAYSHQVITVHEPVKQGILVKHGLKPASIEVIANFADEAIFPLRTSFAVGEKVRFVFHGTILERSGLTILMNALAQVRHQGRILVTIIGEGDYSQGLKELIQTLGLQKVVDFDNRSYPAHAIAERISDCVVGLVPLEISSATDYALPLKLIEYMSIGLPVVCVRNKAIAYYFNDEDCMFFDWDNPKSLADVVDAIVENPQMLLDYRARSVALRQKFSWSVEKQKYANLLFRLAEMPQTAAAQKA